jgi:hypothetical protein
MDDDLAGRMVRLEWTIRKRACPRRLGPPRARFLRAINTVRSPDAALIVAEGSGGREPSGVATSTFAKTADAEDSRIIAVMNARRAQQGKPELTPEQEERVKENRRSERHRAPPS